MCAYIAPLTIVPTVRITCLQGYSAGAIFAGCTRPPPGFTQFIPARYILISYPLELGLFIGLWKMRSYFRSVEALVQGHGWENLPAEFNGKEPDVTGVLTITAKENLPGVYWNRTQVLNDKNVRNVLKQVLVQGTGHAWTGKEQRIVEEVDKWLRDG